MQTILHVIDTTGPGGAETVFIDLVKGTRDRGFRSLALIRGKGWVHDELIRNGIEPIILDCKGSFNVSFLYQLIKLVKKERVDIIQSHLLGSNIYAAMAGLLTRKPVFATFHGTVDISNSERFLKLKAWILNKGVTRFIAVSKGLLKEIKKSGLLNADKAVVIYNGIDTSRYYKRDSSPIRTQLNLDEQAILVGSLGNVRPAKAYDVLIKAASLAVKENANLYFVIAGDTNKEPLMNQLLSLIKELKMESHVHFIGFQEDSAEFLGQMDIFLLTSSSEGFSIATVEALATGLPVIATKCGGPEEINEVTGGIKLVEPNNPHGIANIFTNIESKDFALIQDLFDNSSCASRYITEFKGSLCSRHDR